MLSVDKRFPWCIYPYSSGLLNWHWNNQINALIPVMRPWRIWVKQLVSIHKKNTLQWRHSGHNGVSNHHPYKCLLNRLFRHRSKKKWKLCVPGICAGNSPGTSEFPAQIASTTENVFIWWRHHDLDKTEGKTQEGLCYSLTLTFPFSKWKVYIIPVQDIHTCPPAKCW